MSTRVDGGQRSLPGGANLQKISTSTSLSLSPYATVSVEGLFIWLQYFEGKTCPCRIDKCNPCGIDLDLIS